MVHCVNLSGLLVSLGRELGLGVRNVVTESCVRIGLHIVNKWMWVVLCENV